MVGVLVAVLIFAFIGWVIYQLAKASPPSPKPRPIPRPEPRRSASRGNAVDDGVMADAAGDVAEELVHAAIHSGQQHPHEMDDDAASSVHVSPLAEAPDITSPAEDASSGGSGGWSLFGSDASSDSSGGWSLFGSDDD